MAKRTLAQSTRTQPPRTQKTRNQTDAEDTRTGEHYAILQMGVAIWNQWRAIEPFTIPDLQNADLAGFHLENINLCRANLQGANLCNAYLYEADFQTADLRGANLTRAGLIGANLHKANLRGATIKQAYLAQSDLSNANLSGAYLQKADLQSALLAHTRFSNARIAEAEFTGCFDLTEPQISCARDVHLACFDAPLSAALSQSKRQVYYQAESSVGMSVVDIAVRDKPGSRLFASNKIEPAQPGKQPGKLSEREASRLSSNSEHPLMRRLSKLDNRLNARRNAAVTNVGLS